MAETKEKKGFLITCKQFFGYRHKQTLKGFADEMAAVDMAFRKEIHEYFKSIGIVCRAPDAFHKMKIIPDAQVEDAHIPDNQVEGI